MSLVRENINFERGLDPKEAMKIGMSDTAKLNHVIKTCEKFNLNLQWQADENGDYELVRQDSKNHSTVFSVYNPVTEEFDTWRRPKTKSVNQAIKDILLAEYEDIDEVIKTLEENLINIKKIKEYCSR